MAFEFPSNLPHHLLRGLLVSCVCGFVSCASPGGGSTSPPVPATVKARLRQPVPVVFVGLQDQISLQRPAGTRDVFQRSSGDSQKFWGEMLPAMGEMGQGGAVALLLASPFIAGALVVPPLKSLATSGATVSPKKAEAAAGKLRAQVPQTDWGGLVRRAVTQQWAAHGSSFSTVETMDAGKLSLARDPFCREAFAKFGGRSVLYLHIAGPALTAEGDKLNPLIAPSLMIYWKVIDTTTGSPLAQGTIAERSAERKTLLAWARENDQGLQVELENVIHRAATRLAKELR